MMSVRFSRSFALVSLFWLAGCSEGGASEGMGGAGNAETTVDDWRDFCVATLTEDYEVLEGNGEGLFTAKAGDEYLVSWLELDSAGLVYLAPSGAYDFSIETKGGLWPATFSCTRGQTTPYWAVFVSTTAFADSDLTTPLCELEAGTQSAFDSTSASGITSGGMSGAYFYELRGDALGPKCDGALVGYVEAESTRLFGAARLLPPVGMILGPN